MKKIIVSIGLFCLTVIFSSSGGGAKPPWEEENVSFPMMNQEIRHSMQENTRQKDMNKKQMVNTTLESENKKKWEKLKQTSVKVQDRLRIISFAMQSIPTGIEMSREFDRIKKNQELIMKEIKTAPYTLVVALPVQIQFINDAQMVVRLITGIVLSYGAINQMEKAERKILLDFALKELANLNYTSHYTLMLIRDLKEKVNRTINNLKFYVNRDKAIVGEIITNIKTF